ncbi:polysaccharide pyruvyl transferase family protein [bacterium]|nr:polysaccharide pyruvyl transferase family protein [bacterium]
MTLSTLKKYLPYEIKHPLKTTKNLSIKTTNIIIGAISQNIIKAYWCNTINNFGDSITPLLLKHYGFTPVHTKEQHSQIVLTGSLLEVIPENYNGIILGTGLINGSTTKSFNKAKILGVRGKLTQQIINAPHNIVLGDPGLLASNLLQKQQKKEYILGIVPHYIDKKNPEIKKLFNKYKKEILIIDVTRSPIKVIQDIDKCENIISSSLHGLITADSLGIPNAWILLSDKVIGNGFKFYDYVSALETKIKSNKITGNEKLTELIKLTTKPADTIPEIKHNLHQTFIALPRRPMHSSAA